MTRVSPALLRLAAAKNAAASPARPHHRTALACRSYPELLTPGELWFLDSILLLSTISDVQQARLNQIAVKVEMGRRK
jgi:hypothetical protein